MRARYVALALGLAALPACKGIDEALWGPSPVAAREWYVGVSPVPGDSLSIVDPLERPLTICLRPGQRLQLGVHMISPIHQGPLPDSHWYSSAPSVARYAKAETYHYAELLGVAQGETQIWAMLDVYDGVRADPHFYCCADTCAKWAPEVTQCERIPIRAIRVVP